MKRFATIALALAMGAAITGCTSTPRSDVVTSAVSPRRPVATYSIVARDPDTGEIGVAVQSHWFSVGSLVPWAESGVGAVATQSLTDPSYGALGLELMRNGRSASETLRALVAGDDEREVRQVGMVDADGNASSHTGSRCIAAAGHVVDSRGQFCVQANLMESDTTWRKMADAYRSATGDLAARMLAALDAAEKAGGDIRGRQSAALIVVAGKPTGQTWNDRRFDLRVEDHPDPLVELRRLVRIQRAYLRMNEGDLALEQGNFRSALRHYAEAQRFAPEILEIAFWRAVTLVSVDRRSDAEPLFREVFSKEPEWADLVPRLAPAGLLPDDPAVIQWIVDLSSPAPVER